MSWAKDQTDSADIDGASLQVPAEQMWRKLLPAKLYCPMKQFGLLREVGPDPYAGTTVAFQFQQIPIARYRPKYSVTTVPPADPLHAARWACARAAASLVKEDDRTSPAAAWKVRFESHDQKTVPPADPLYATR